MNYWDGDLPLVERQSVQAFQRVEEPRILEFRRRLAEVGGGEWVARSFGSSISKWDDDSAGFAQDSWELQGQMSAGPFVAIPEIERIGREVLSGTYPDYELGSDKGGVRQLSWSDPHNGGFLYVTVHDGQALLMVVLRILAISFPTASKSTSQRTKDVCGMEPSEDLVVFRFECLFGDCFFKARSRSSTGRVDSKEYFWFPGAGRYSRRSAYSDGNCAYGSLNSG